jgi:Protein of unknown function (DUF550)
MDKVAEYVRRQREWSLKTFGEGLHTGPITEHIKKELVEITEAPTDLMEWVDVMILAMDGYQRAGGEPEDLMGLLERKHQINLTRKFPPMEEGKVSEHIKEADHFDVEPTKDVYLGVTTDRNDPALHNVLPNGMQQKHLVLPKEGEFVRPYRDRYIHLKCGGETIMGRDLAETYARKPKFYGGTWCSHCGRYFDLNGYREGLKDDENPVWEHKFTWSVDGTPVGS